MQLRYRLFVHDSWNIFWWFVAPVLPWAIYRLCRIGQSAAAAYITGLAAFTLFVFLFTPNAGFAVMGWTLDRSVMQVAPAIMAGVIWAFLRSREPLAISR